MLLAKCVYLYIKICCLFGDLKLYLFSLLLLLFFIITIIVVVIIVIIRFWIVYTLVKQIHF